MYNLNHNDYSSILLVYTLFLSANDLINSIGRIKSGIIVYTTLIGSIL